MGLVLLTPFSQQHCWGIETAEPQRHSHRYSRLGTNKLLKNGLDRKWQKQCVSSPSAGIESQTGSG